MDGVLLVHRGAAVAGRALHGDPDLGGEALADVGGVADLFLGHAESLARVSSAFVPIRFQGAIVYQKPEEPRP